MSSQRTRRRLWQLGGALLLAAVVVVTIALAAGGGDDGRPVRQPGERLAGERESRTLLAGLPQDGAVLGEPDAPVTLVEFADLQCPFCARYATTVFPELVRRYVRGGQVRMIFRDVAFLGTDSVRAGQMAGALASQDKLWNFVDLFYVNQGAENSGYVTDPFLRKVARAISGADVERAMADRGLPAIADAMDAARREADSYSIPGTPSFAVGATGGKLTLMSKEEAGSLEAMSARIDGEIEEAS
jgi:protein-disulfide isomerase